MADEVRFAPVNGHPRRYSSLPNAISNRKARSSDRAQVGGFNSPVIQPAETVFIGSLATVFVKPWSLKRAELKALRAGHNPDQHRAASRRNSPVQFCSFPEI
jgi:hypothetical protein